MTLHHVEVWVPDLDRAAASWGWLLVELGYVIYQDWPGGRSWRPSQAKGTYFVLEASTDLTAATHDRTAPGLNHLAFAVGDRRKVDEFTTNAPAHGWRLLFADRHPYAGGPGHYAAYLENDDGYEVELIAT